MSKRHQSSRRKSYGRRQHEVAERRSQAPALDASDDALGEFGQPVLGERFAFLDPRLSSLRFALGD